MNNEAKLKKLLKTGGALKALGIFFIILALLLGALGAYLGYDAATQKAMRYPLIEEGDYVEFDVQHISDYFASYDDTTYYCYASDENFDWVVLSLSKSDFEKEFAEVYEYTYSDSWDAPPTVKVYGAVRNMTDAADELLAYASDFVREYDLLDLPLRGSDLLYIVKDSVPGWDATIGFGCVAVLLLVVAICLLAKKGSLGKTAAKSIENLRAQNAIDAALADYNDPASVKADKKGKVVFGSSYIFSRSLGAIIPYNEVLMAYIQRNSTNGVPVSQSLIIKTADRKTRTLLVDNLFEASNQRMQQYFEIISSHNPVCLIGASDENFAACNERLLTINPAD